MALHGYVYREKSFDTQFDLPNKALRGIMEGEFGQDGTFRAKPYDGIVRLASCGVLTLTTESGDTQWCGRVALALSCLLHDTPDTAFYRAYGYTIAREEVVALESLFKQAFQKGCQYWGYA